MGGWEFVLWVGVEGHQWQLRRCCYPADTTTHCQGEGGERKKCRKKCRWVNAGVAIPLIQQHPAKEKEEEKGRKGVKEIQEGPPRWVNGGAEKERKETGETERKLEKKRRRRRRKKI